MKKENGFSLIELLTAVVIAALLFAAMQNVITPALDANAYLHERNEIIQQARFSMERMVQAASHSQRILLPYNDKPTTSFPDNIREQTIPASPPPPGSSFATAVFAVTQDPSVDLDGNGVVDVDNDGDGRIDEDVPSDMTNDSEPGIKGIDDDGDGSVDEGFFADGDDDESFNISNEDQFDRVDNDGDNNIDEDLPADMNNDNAPGIIGVDDDGDSFVDEGSDDDDDEDGQNNEDWLDAVVFYLQGDALVERIPVPWDADASGTITGADYIETTLIENVTRFRVERITPNNDRVPVVELTLEITPLDGEMFSLTTRVRVGDTL